MANQFTSNTLSGIYSDDYDPTDNYHQILFNNGRALQARELTQLQTLIYAELARFGKNIFKEGALINSGGMAINANYEYIKVSATNSGGAFSDIPVGTVFRNPNTNVSARVLEVSARSDTQVLDTLYVQYINSGGDVITQTPTRFGDGEILYDQTGGGYVITTEVPNATGQGTKFTLGEGSFFVLGRFVQSNEQSIIIEPYSSVANAVVGFKVIQEVISVNDTSTLYDNSNGVVNTSSPGADRYRIRLELTTQNQVSTDDTFVFIARIENSNIVEAIEESDAYNKIEEFIALRTSEESGNYVVNPFVVNIEDNNSLDSNLELIVSPGIAYINGYRVEKSSSTKLNIPRPQETETVENDIIPVVYGNYFLTNNNRGLPALDYSEANIYDNVGATGSIIGTARIRAVEKDGINHRIYVFDVSLTGSLRDAKSIGTSSSNYFDIVRETAGAKLYGTLDNDLLFPTSRPRPESFADIILTKQVHQNSLTANGSGVITLPTLPAGQAYTDTSLWIVSTANAPATPHTVQTPTNSGRDVQISGLSSGSDYAVLAYVQKTATRKAKTLTSDITTLSKQVDGETGQIFYEFAMPDVYEIDSARSNNSSGFNVLPSLTFDDGQRDNYYAKSKLLFNQADSAPENLYVNFQYFARGAGGDFYDATSYGNLPVAYRDIPSHVLKDGTKINLRNYLDFRSDETSFSTGFDLPRNGANITADVNYYLPRADKLLMTQEGEIQLLLGQQAGIPQYKTTPDNALELYKIRLNANTLDKDDLQVTPVEHKRYTMADIAQLEAKIDDLQEYTTLSILELEQKLKPALDSDGIERVESGSQVDDFSDQTGADTKNEDYAASIDPESKLIRPMIDEDNIRLIMDNTLSNNVMKKGDNVYLRHDSAEWAYQSLASRSIKINPFGLVDNVGTIKLSPTSDEWKESVQNAEKAIAGSGKLDRKQAFLWNNWSWNWFGRNIEDVDLSNFGELQAQKNLTGLRKRSLIDFRENYSSTTSSIGPRIGNGKFISRVAPSDTLREVVGKRFIDLALIPWIRARKIYFHAKGLKPNTKFTPFFDGKKVVEWCRQESTFVNYSDRDDDNGNKYTHQAITQHPSGFTELISDENGEIIGSFFVPNVTPTNYLKRVNTNSKQKDEGFRFRSGIREFKLLDIDTNDWAAAGSKAFTYYAVQGALWNNWKNMITTRPSEYWQPVGASNKFPQAYTSKEIQNYLNQVRTAQVNIVDPKLAGKYGPSAAPLSVAALNGLDANGQMSQVLSDYVDVDQNQYASNIVSTVSSPQNPLAQTFYVDNQFGVVLTSLQLFFRTKDSGNLPVSIHLRPVVNGRPSNNDIVPGSYVYLTPAQVSTVENSPTLSTIQETPTRFTFDEPVYLKPWVHYAIVITSQSTEYELYSAKTQEPVFGSTSRMVTTQPAPGSLYLPQNGVFWVETKDQDIMYRLNRAKFDIGGGSVILKNANLPPKLLNENPIQTYSGTRKIYVHHKCHGLEPGDLAFVDSAENIAGINANSWINGSHVVDSADIHGFTFTYDAAAPVASSSVIGGGEKVLSRKNSIFNVINPYIETIVPNNTSIDVSGKFTEGKNISSTRITAGERWSQDEEYSRITLKQNVEFDTPKAIYNFAAQELNLGAGVASSYVKIDLKSSNDYVSPVVDLQRASLSLIGFCQDNPEITPHINGVDETQPSGGTTGSKHITSPVLLDQDAVGIEAKASVNIPKDAEIDFYFRTAGGDENIYDKSWELQEMEYTIPKDNNLTLREATWLPGGRNGALKPFNQAQVKMVMRGADRNATIRNLKLRYLAT